MGRTVVDLNDALVKRAKELTGFKKKVDVVNFALEELVKTKEIRKILELRRTAKEVPWRKGWSR